MLRFRSPDGARPASVYAIPRRMTRPSFIAAALAAFALSGGVAAKSLAQPGESALEARAADYVRFREDIAAIEKTPFTGPQATREAHKLLSAHSPDALSGGWVAYAALVAADSPEFAKSLQQAINSNRRDKNGLKGADAFLARLAADPTYPRKLKGADEAVGRVLAMTASDVARVEALGEAFKTQAYAMQKTAWGKKPIGPGSQRLAEAAAFAHNRTPAPIAPLQVSMTKGVAAPELQEAGDAWSPDWGEKSAPQGNSEANANIVLDRVLNLAARYAAGGLNEKTVAVYAKNDHADQCLSMTELTLKQCIAATRTPYEEAFCLGEHGLNDVGGCLGWVAGAN